jgi:hypothetical protein
MPADTRPTKRTQLDCIRDVLRDALGALTVREIVDDLDRFHPGWTTVPHDVGKIGIVNRLTSTSCLDYDSPPFERVHEGDDGLIRWRLRTDVVC